MKGLLRKLSRWIHDQEACPKCGGGGKTEHVKWRGDVGETELLSCSECGGDGIWKAKGS